MNVHKFDIRLPPFRSDAREGQLDAAARDDRKLWAGGVVPYIIDRSIRKYQEVKRNADDHPRRYTGGICLSSCVI